MKQTYCFLSNSIITLYHVFLWYVLRFPFVLHCYLVIFRRWINEWITFVSVIKFLNNRKRSKYTFYFLLLLLFKRKINICYLSEYSIYSGWTLATLRNSLACVCGHCISHQLIGTILTPTTQRIFRDSDVWVHMETPYFHTSCLFPEVRVNFCHQNVKCMKL